MLEEALEHLVRGIVQYPDDVRVRSRALRRGSSDSLNQTGQQIVRRNLNVQPTLTIRPGFPVRVIVNRDLVLAPYPSCGGMQCPS